MFLPRIIVLCFVLFSGSLFAAQVNINKASADDIASALEGVGPSKAAAIVQFRADNGPFKSIEELKYVRGIGSKILSKIKDDIILASDEE